MLADTITQPPRRRQLYRRQQLSRCLAMLLLLLGSLAGADQRQPPPGWQLDDPDQALPRLEVPGIDAGVRRKSDDLDRKPGMPLRFAESRKLAIDVLEHAEISTLADGQRIARLAIEAPGATDLSLAFSNFHLPEGARLYLYDEAQSLFQGSWDARQNRSHGEFWSPAVPGDTAIIELLFSSTTRQLPTLQLASVQAGFRDLFGRQDGPFFAKARGECNIDVACPQGDAWRDEIRSVARYTFGGGFICTGTLINDVSGSLTPWFLTAEHCAVSNPASVVVYWNFQASSCGGPAPSLSAQTQSGASLRAARNDVDMRLLELDARPDASFNVHYAGWDRAATPANGAVGIHHPDGDIKSISISSNPLSVTDNCIAPGNNTHWRINSWAEGTTEPGSSGSGIWNPANQRLVGFLSGGNASCSNTAGTDCYGRFDIAWDGPSADQRLRDWLDPSGNDPASISGINPSDFFLSSTASEFSQCGTGSLPIPIQVTAKGGFDEPVTLSTSGLPAGSTAGFSSNPVTPTGNSTLTLGNLPIGDSPFTLIGNASGTQRTLALTVRQFSQAPTDPTLLQPADGAIDIDTAATISWQAVADVDDYEVQIATDAAFANIVQQQSSSNTTLTLTTLLDRGVTHYVRVRARNDCGDGPWSNTHSFTTAENFCATPAAAIPDNNTAGVQSMINVPHDMTIGNLGLLLDISHTFVGDLRVELQQQSSGLSRLLVDQPPGDGSCSGADIAVTLDDSAVPRIQNGCDAVNAYTEPAYRPTNSLAPFAGTELMTAWTLTVTDNVAQDTGTLNRWCLIPKQQTESAGGGGGGGGSLSIGLLLSLALLWRRPARRRGAPITQHDLCRCATATLSGRRL